MPEKNQLQKRKAKRKKRGDNMFIFKSTVYKIYQGIGGTSLMEVITSCK